MVRRNDRQQYNLSQDMMAKAINQANRCFSIVSHKPKQKLKLSISSNEVIIMPEMEVAVIFPDTGKSLKHSELITKFKYKIKWIRSTANEINSLYNTTKIRFKKTVQYPKRKKSDVWIICDEY
jgi:hypothetical protein